MSDMMGCMPHHFLILVKVWGQKVPELYCPATNYCQVLIIAIHNSNRYNLTKNNIPGLANHVKLF